MTICRSELSVLLPFAMYGMMGTGINPFAITADVPKRGATGPWRSMSGSVSPRITLHGQTRWVWPENDDTAHWQTWCGTEADLKRETPFYSATTADEKSAHGAWVSQMNAVMRWLQKTSGAAVSIETVEIVRGGRP